MGDLIQFPSDGRRPKEPEPMKMFCSTCGREAQPSKTPPVGMSWEKCSCGGVVFTNQPHLFGGARAADTGLNVTVPVYVDGTATWFGGNTW